MTRLRDFFLQPPVDERDSAIEQGLSRTSTSGSLILRRERDGGMEAMLLAMATGYDYRKYQKVKAVERRGR